MSLSNPALTSRRSPAAWLWSEMRVGVPLCVAVAAFLSVVFSDSFATMLVYSLCIGTVIQYSIEGGRHAITGMLRRRQPDRPGLEADWPGWAWMAPWVLLCSVGGYWLGSQLADMLTGNVRDHNQFPHNLRVLALILVVTVVAAAGTTYFFWSRGRMASAEAQAEAARRSAAEIQLKLLQSQLEPHMLFNTLANLRVLIGLDAQQAQHMLDRLIAFLRATLNASRTESHALEAEFARVADYLALMAIRMGPRLTHHLDLPDELRALPVPPLLLQPLVENSIRHGLEPQVEGGHIDIKARREGEWLRLTVSDSGVGLGGALSTQGTGFGTSQVRERLAAQFGSRGRFELAADAAGGTLATVILPLAMSNAAPAVSKSPP